MPVTLPNLSPLVPWYRQNKRDLPWRNTRDPYRIWVSEIMLQQTRVEAVLPYYARFLAALPTVRDLAAVPEAQLLKLWEGLGYYSRARHMQAAAKTVMAAYGGVFPATFEGIRALPGVGDYTAGAIASFAFDLPYPAVDGNVLRVAARLAAYKNDVLSPAAKKELTAAVAAAQPEKEAADFNQALIELGALVCLPGAAAKCDICPLAAVCRAHAAGLVAQLPVRKKPAPRKKEPRTVLILRIEDTVALRRRPDAGLLAGLFEPFCLPGRLSEEAVRAALADLGVTPERLTPLGEAKHVFTHLEWHMTGYEVLLTPADTACLPSDLLFVPRDELDRAYPLPSAYAAYRAYM